MTNMGCYAIDYVVACMGSPKAVQANRMSFWEEYTRAGLENFGQIILHYEDFDAMLSVGKQQLDDPRQHANWLSVQFRNRTFLVEPHNGVVIIDGVQRPMEEYLAGYEVEGSFDELIRCIRTDAQPDSDAETAMRGVEVLMAAYRSAVEGGRIVQLPLEDGTNPLVA